MKPFDELESRLARDRLFMQPQPEHGVRHPETGQVFSLGEFGSGGASYDASRPTWELLGRPELKPGEETVSDDLQKTTVQALAVLDRDTEAAWEGSLGAVGLNVAHALRRRDPAEVASMPHDEIRHLLQLALVGHTYMCHQKMSRDNAA